MESCNHDRPGNVTGKFEVVYIDNVRRAVSRLAELATALRNDSVRENASMAISTNNYSNTQCSGRLFHPKSQMYVLLIIEVIILFGNVASGKRSIIPSYTDSEDK